MENYSFTGIILVILGVLLIVFGAGAVLGGFNDMDASASWEPPEQDNCQTSVENDENKSFVEEMKEAESDCPGSGTGENPYNSGEEKALVGGFLVVIGGVSAYAGNRR